MSTPTPSRRGTVTLQPAWAKPSPPDNPPPSRRVGMRQKGIPSALAIRPTLCAETASRSAGSTTPDKHNRNPTAGETRRGGAVVMSGTKTPEIVIKTAAGSELPLVASTEQIAGATGETGRAVRLKCEAGSIPTLPRVGGDQAHWRIPVAKWLDSIGMPYEFVEVVVDEEAAA